MPVSNAPGATRDTAKTRLASGPDPDLDLVDLGRRLSVFLPNFNHGHLLPRALDGLLAQSVKPAEICVVDDGSTDDSAAIIADYARRFTNIRAIYRDRNIGVFANLSHWLAEATTEFVYFAAADDYVLPTLFAQSLRLMTQFPQAALCSSLIMIANDAGRSVGTFQTPRPCRVPCYIAPRRARQLLMSDDSWMVGTSTIYRLNHLRRAGGFDARLAGFTDGFVSRALAVEHGACFIPEPLAVWQRSDSGIAGQTLENPKTALEIEQHVVDLISRSPHGLFAEGYPRRWRGRWRYAIAVRGLVAPAGPFGGFEAVLAPLRPWDKAALAILRRFPFGRATLATLYAFLRLRPRDIPVVLMRRLSYLAPRR
jgi:glycosyltransferase involved in cell wall biosynthesis